MTKQRKYKLCSFLTNSSIAFCYLSYVRKWSVRFCPSLDRWILLNGLHRALYISVPSNPVQYSLTLVLLHDSYSIVMIFLTHLAGLTLMVGTLNLPPVSNNLPLSNHLSDSEETKQFRRYDTASSQGSSIHYLRFDAI